MTKFLITITGPSGSGKSELLKRMISTGQAVRLISHATRDKRPGETDGVDYHFVSKEYFESEDAAGNFVQTVNFRGQWYGTHEESIDECFKEGKYPVVIVEPGGVSQFATFCKQNGYTLLPIYVNAPLDTLIERYIERLTPNDFLSQEKITYHSDRLRGIVMEYNTWAFSQSFKLVIENPGKDMSRMAQFITDIDNLIYKERTKLGNKS